MGKLTTAQKEWLAALGVKTFGSLGETDAKTTGLAAGLAAVDLKADAKTAAAKSSSSKDDLSDQGDARESSPGGANAEAFDFMSGQVSADSDMPDEPQGKVHPKLVEMTPPPGVTLPTLKQPVVLVSENGKPQEMSRSEITKRPDYVDNFTKATLNVPIAWEMKDAAKLKLNLYYSSGSPFSLPWPWILFQWEQPAYKYAYQFGKIVPQASDGNPLLDKNNTPSIIVAALLFKDELDKLAEQYEQIADLVYTVGGAIAASGSHMSSIPTGSFSGGYKSKSKGPARSGPKGSGRQTQSGGRSGSRSGATPKPATGKTTGSSGGAGGKPPAANGDGLPPVSMKLNEGSTGKKGNQGGGGDGASFKGGDKNADKPGGKKGGSSFKGGKGEKRPKVISNKPDGKSDQGGADKTGEGTAKSDAPDSQASGGPNKGDKGTQGTGAQPPAKGGAPNAPKKSNVLSPDKMKNVKKLDGSKADRDFLNGKEEGQALTIAAVLDEANNKNALLNDANDAGGVQRRRNVDAAMETLGQNSKYRLKPMEGNYSDYMETTLVSDTAAGTGGSKMRLIFRIDVNSGKFHSIRVVEMHPPPKVN